MKNISSRRKFINSAVLGTGAMLGLPHVAVSGTPDHTWLNVMDFGAVGDKNTVSTQAFQKAIDRAYDAGGGVVMVPAGDYRLGCIELKSDVELKIETGATLWATDHEDDYELSRKLTGRRSLIAAVDAERIAVTGNGRIYGVGFDELDRRSDPERPDLRPRIRFGIISFTDCRNVRLHGTRIYYSDSHTVTLRRCENVFVDNVHIINNYWRTNSDGINPWSCRNVLITNTRIIAGDDCICPKSEKGIPCENIVISNCVLESIATAIKIGTPTGGDFRDIKVSNTVIRNSGVGLGIFMQDGATVERISFNNISIETTPQSTETNTRLRNNIFPIYIDIDQRNPDSQIGRIRDISFSDIQIISDNAVYISGIPESIIENVTFSNVTFKVNESFSFENREKRSGHTGVTERAEMAVQLVRSPSFITLAYIDGFTADNVQVLVKDEIFPSSPKSAIHLHDVKNGTIHNLGRRPAGWINGEPVITLRDCFRILISGCMPMQDTKPGFLGVRGARSNKIFLKGNVLDGKERAVIREEEVSDDAVFIDD